MQIGDRRLKEINLTDNSGSCFPSAIHALFTAGSLSLRTTGKGLWGARNRQGRTSCSANLFLHSSSRRGSPCRSPPPRKQEWPAPHRAQFPPPPRTPRLPTSSTSGVAGTIAGTATDGMAPAGIGAAILGASVLAGAARGAGTDGAAASAGVGAAAATGATAIGGATPGMATAGVVMAGMDALGMDMLGMVAPGMGMARRPAATADAGPTKLGFA